MPTSTRRKPVDALPPGQQVDRRAGQQPAGQGGDRRPDQRGSRRARRRRARSARPRRRPRPAVMPEDVGAGQRVAGERLQDRAGHAERQRRPARAVSARGSRSSSTTNRSPFSPPPSRIAQHVQRGRSGSRPRPTSTAASSSDDRRRGPPARATARGRHTAESGADAERGGGRAPRSAAALTASPAGGGAPAR